MLHSFNTQVTQFKRVTKTEAKDRKTSNLIDLLVTNEYQAAVEKVREAYRDAYRAADNKESIEKAKDMKRETLPAWTPSGLFDGGKLEDLVRHSGFICLDFDYKDNCGQKGYSHLRELLSKFPYTYYCGRSCSGMGFYALVKVAVTGTNTEEDIKLHQGYFQTLSEGLKECGLIVDPATKDPSRKRFVSYDPSAYLNTSSKVYDILPDGYKHRVPPMRTSPEDLGELAKIVEIVLQDLLERGEDCTESYDYWYKCLQALANTFGEEGRSYAHDISSNYSGYDPNEVDKQFDGCLKAVRNPDAQRVGIGTLFEIAMPHLSAKAKEEAFANRTDYFKGIG